MNNSFVEIEIALTLEPYLVGLQDIEAVLLARMAGLFCAWSRPAQTSSIAWRGWWSHRVPLAYLATPPESDRAVGSIDSRTKAT